VNPDIDEAAYGPVLRAVFVFDEHRPFVSGNHLRGTNFAARRHFLTREAREQKTRLQQEAALAARAAKWSMPDYCYLEIIGMNIDSDGDNLSKPFCDALERSWYYTDRRIKDRRIISIRDKGAARVVVAVQAVHGKAFGFAKPSKRKDRAGGHVPQREYRTTHPAPRKVRRRRSTT
jgi:hypothetical protein